MPRRGACIWDGRTAGRRISGPKGAPCIGPSRTPTPGWLRCTAKPQQFRSYLLWLVIRSECVTSTVCHSQGNVTGFTPFEPSLGGKWLSLLKEIAPRVEHVGLLFNPEMGNSASAFVQPIEAAAPALGIKSIVRPLKESAEINRMISALSQVPNSGLIFLPDAFTAVHREMIVALVARHHVPATYPLRTFSTAGGLMSYGIDTNQLFRQAASYVDRILRGTDPGDLPVQAPTKFELVINLKTAKALGLEIPPTLVARADEVIK
jgi:putative ABC transport system substrate-binding protein